MLRFLAIMLLAFLPWPAAAEPAAAPSLAGSWALKVDGTPMFRFDLTAAGEGWSGSWWRPASFASDGNSFSRVSGPAVEVVSGEGKADGEWTELTFPDARPGAVPDVFRFRLIGRDRVEMVYVDTHLPPYTLVRVAKRVKLGPWDAEHVYRRVSVESLGLPSDTQTLALPDAEPAKAPEATPKATPDAAPASPPQVLVYSLPPGAKPVEGR